MLSGPAAACSAGCGKTAAGPRWIYGPGKEGVEREREEEGGKEGTRFSDRVIMMAMELRQRRPIPAAEGTLPGPGRRLAAIVPRSDSEVIDVS